jgi:hypothetical protein
MMLIIRIECTWHMEIEGVRWRVGQWSEVLLFDSHDCLEGNKGIVVESF